jgi:hypothetical protein
MNRDYRSLQSNAKFGLSPPAQEYPFANYIIAQASVHSFAFLAPSVFIMFSCERICAHCLSMISPMKVLFLF